MFPEDFNFWHRMLADRTVKFFRLGRLGRLGRGLRAGCQQG